MDRDEHSGGQQPDPIGAESAPVDVPAPSEEPSSTDTEAQNVETPAERETEAAKPQADDESAGSQDAQPRESVGVGGTGDHPAPAAVVGPDGQLHVAGEPPNNLIAGTQTPAGDSPDLSSGDVSAEAAEKLNAPSEPVQFETDRPDIGTPE